ncbi:hypothetical protein, partial [Armatimonas sp.]|uniref:hypothetical protein n=1 Tax=Armatimonas sp. TaxID=1872638 RepID=UPI003753B65F
MTAQGILPTITYLDIDGGGHLTRLMVAYPNGTYDRDDSWAYGGPNGDSIITEFVGGLTRTNTWISAPYKDYNEMVTPRLSSFTLGDTNDTSSADQGVAGTYQVNLGTATLGYGSFGVRSRTFSITDPLGATWKEILGAGANWLDNSYHETILRSRHVEGPDYTGTPLNSNHSTMVFLPEMRNPTEITLTDAFDMVWKAFFDSFGNVSKTRNPFGQEWEFTYSTDGKNLTQVKDPTNITTNYIYGQFGYLPSRLTSILDHANVEQLRLGWNSFGQLEQLITLPTTAASGFEETTTLEYFNTTGDLKSVIDPLGGRIDIINVDGLGDPIMLGLYPLTGSSVTEPHPLVTSLEWTAAQDVKSVLFPNGLKLEHTINPKGQRTKSQVKNSGGTLLGQFDFEYDTRGRLHHAYDSIGDLFKIKFDTAGNLTRSIDGNDHATVLTYGLAGDVSGITTPTGRQASFTYDRDGSPKSITDARQITTNFGYDSAGRPEVTWVTGQPNEMVVNHYDNAGRLTLVNTPTGKSVAFAYNHANKWLTSVTTTMPLGGVYSRVHTVSYTYYPDGKRQTMTTQATGVAATTTGYTYDKNGRMKTLTAPGGAVTSWNYDFIGRPLSQITLYSG